jgi:hypothetical protein
MHDQAQEPVPAGDVVRRLVAGQPGTSGSVPVLDLAGPAVGGAVGDLPAAARPQPGHGQVSGE